MAQAPSKPRCVALFICLDVKFNYQKQTISLVDIITDYPIRHPLLDTSQVPLWVVTYWRGIPGAPLSFVQRITGPGRLNVEEPSQTHIGENGATFDALKLTTTKFTQYGDYLFEVLVDGQVVLSDSLAVVPMR